MCTSSEISIDEPLGSFSAGETNWIFDRSQHRNVRAWFARGPLFPIARPPRLMATISLAVDRSESLSSRSDVPSTRGITDPEINRA